MGSFFIFAALFKTRGGVFVVGGRVSQRYHISARHKDTVQSTSKLPHQTSTDRTSHHPKITKHQTFHNATNKHYNITDDAWKDESVNKETFSPFLLFFLYSILNPTPLIHPFIDSLFY
jgi:hypothetical protein